MHVRITERKIALIWVRKLGILQNLSFFSTDHNFQGHFLHGRQYLIFDIVRRRLRFGTGFA
jgi:hypothetical protein